MKFSRRSIAELGAGLGSVSGLTTLGIKLDEANRSVTQSAEIVKKQEDKIKTLETALSLLNNTLAKLKNVDTQNVQELKDRLMTILRDLKNYRHMFRNAQALVKELDAANKVLLEKLDDALTKLSEAKGEVDDLKGWVKDLTANLEGLSGNYKKVLMGFIPQSDIETDLESHETIDGQTQSKSPTKREAIPNQWVTRTGCPLYNYFTAE